MFRFKGACTQAAWGCRPANLEGAWWNCDWLAMQSKCHPSMTKMQVAQLKVPESYSVARIDSPPKKDIETPCSVPAGGPIARFHRNLGIPFNPTAILDSRFFPRPWHTVSALGRVGRNCLVRHHGETDQRVKDVLPNRSRIPSWVILGPIFT